MEIMDVNSLVSTAVLKKLKCSKCQNYLSYFPIYISPDKLNICGRCSQLKEENCIRNEVYEAICEKISFPCRYINEGCAEEVLAKEMSAHERSCTFRIVKCPVAELTQCDWKGSHPNLLQHCHDNHSDMILKNGKFQLQLSKSQKCENLVPYKEELVLFIRNFDSTNKVLNYSVHQLDDIISFGLSCCNFKIIFRHKGRTLSIDDYLYILLNKKSMTEISLDVLKDPCEDSDTIEGMIDLEEPSQKHTFFSKTINEALLSQLQCSVCHEHLMPPLDLYAEKQTKCAQCRAKDSSRGYSYSTQITNIKLDKIADLIHYPCKYKKNGCTFVSYPVDMKLHQEGCPYENQVCPLSEFEKCEWSGLNKDVVCHIEKDHSQTILASSVITERLLKGHWGSSTYGELIKCYVMKFNNCLFRLIFCYKNGRFCWTVNEIGSGRFSNHFKYDIEVTDENKSNRKLHMRQVCTQALSKKDEIFANAKEYCYFHLDQVQSLLCQDIITFKVHIVK